jgi:hypothetical protein
MGSKLSLKDYFRLTIFTFMVFDDYLNNFENLRKI